MRYIHLLRTFTRGLRTASPSAQSNAGNSSSSTRLHNLGSRLNQALQPQAEIMEESIRTTKNLKETIEEAKNILNNLYFKSFFFLSMVGVGEFALTTLTDVLAQREITEKNHDLLNDILTQIDTQKNINDQFQNSDDRLKILEFPKWNSIYRGIYRTKFLSLGYLVKSFFGAAPAEMYSDFYIANILILQGDLALAEQISESLLAQRYNAYEAYLIKALVSFKKGDLSLSANYLELCEKYLNEMKSSKKLLTQAEFLYLESCRDIPKTEEFIKRLKNKINTFEEQKVILQDLEPLLEKKSDVPTTPYEYASYAYKNFDEPYYTHYEKERNELIVCFNPANFSHFDKEQLKKYIDREKNKITHLTFIGTQSAAPLAAYAARVFKNEQSTEHLTIRYVGFDSPGRIGFLANQERLLPETAFNPATFDGVEYFGYPTKANTTGKHETDTLQYQLSPQQNDSSAWISPSWYVWNFPDFLNNALHTSRSAAHTLAASFLQSVLLYYLPASGQIEIGSFAAFSTPAVCLALTGLLWGVNYGLNQIPSFQQPICFCSNCNHADLLGDNHASINSNNLTRYFDDKSGQLQLNKNIGLPLIMIKWPASLEKYGCFLSVLTRHPSLHDKTFTCDANTRSRLLSAYQFKLYDNTLKLTDLSPKQQRYLFDYLTTQGANDPKALPGLLQFQIKEGVITVLSAVTPEYFFRYIDYRVKSLEKLRSELKSISPYFNQRCAFFRAKLIENDRSPYSPSIGTVGNFASAKIFSFP